LNYHAGEVPQYQAQAAAACVLQGIPEVPVLQAKAATARVLVQHQHRPSLLEKRIFF
jgi:hypothetical protein